MHSVFISYSSKDANQAETVRNVLEQNGIICWMAPRDIPGGSNYTKEIPVAIRDCQVFVLILSQNAQCSPWVLKELDSAVNNGKVILPFMLEDCELNDEFNFLLTGAQRYSAYQKKAEAMETLIARIRALTTPQSNNTAEENSPAKTEGQVAQTAAPVSPAKSASVHQVTSPGGTAGTKAPKNSSREVEYLGPTRCPACDGMNLVELPKKIGCFDFVEWLLSAGLILLLGNVISFAAVIIEVIIYVIFASYETPDIYLSFLLYVSGFVGGCILGKFLANELIRRRRVRKHLFQHPLRCQACKKKFLPHKQ